jgi:hypothetical protein
MLAAMKYEEELREGCRSLGEARQTRERRAQLAETRPWKTGDQKTETRLVQLAQQNVMILRQCLGSSSSFDYCSVHAAKGSLACGLLRFPSVSPRLHSPFASRHGHPNSAVQRRRAARLHLPESKPSKASKPSKELSILGGQEQDQKSSGRVAEKKHRGQWQRRSGVSSSARSALGRKQLAALPSTPQHSPALLARCTVHAAALRCAASRTARWTRNALFGYKVCTHAAHGIHSLLLAHLFVPSPSLSSSSSPVTLHRFCIQTLHLLHLHPHPGISHHIHHFHHIHHHLHPDLYHISSTAGCSATSGIWRSPQPPNHGTCVGLRIRYHSLYRLLRLPPIVHCIPTPTLLLSASATAIWALVRSFALGVQPPTFFIPLDSTRLNFHSSIPSPSRLLAFAVAFLCCGRHLFRPATAKDEQSAHRTIHPH